VKRFVLGWCFAHVVFFFGWEVGCLSLFVMGCCGLGGHSCSFSVFVSGLRCLQRRRKKKKVNDEERKNKKETEKEYPCLWLSGQLRIGIGMDWSGIELN